MGLDTREAGLERNAPGGMSFYQLDLLNSYASFKTLPQCISGNSTPVLGRKGIPLMPLQRPLR